MELVRELALYEGELLLAAGRADEAVSALEKLLQELPPGHRKRGRALVELGAALAARSAAANEAAGNSAVLAASVARLREAVDEEGWSDWAWIRWRPGLEPVHGRRDYAALLARHGRSPGPPAGVEVADGQ
jgi:hypothetical protein